MSMNLTRTNAYADLDDAWVRHQTARLHQRHLQYGRHCRLDVDAVLERAARLVRAARSIQALSKRENVSTDHLRRATIEAIDHCAWLEYRSSARVMEDRYAQPSIGG